MSEQKESKFMSNLEKVMMPIAGKISENRYLLAIRDGFMLAMPLLIVGAMSLLFANFPITGYGDFMKGIFGAGWDDFFNIPYNCSMALMTIFVIIGIAVSLSKYYDIEPVSTGVVALVGFLIVTPFWMNYTPTGTKSHFFISGIIPTTWLGSSGLFVGMLVAIIATEIVRQIDHRGWVIKMPAGVPPSVSKAFSALIPAFFVMYFFNIVRLGFTYTPYSTIHNFIFKILQEPLTSLGATYPASVIANFFMDFFWIFGIHGTNVVGAVTQPLWMSLQAENVAAYQAGKALPHIVIQSYQDIFMQLGGTGCTLGLCLSMIFLCKSEQCKKIGKLAIIPGIFNINEPITFGLPIVLNPIMAIPFIIVPFVMNTMCYFSIASGLVPRLSGILIPWTTPPVIGGFLVCGVRGAILQIVELLVATLIYLPFLKMVDKNYYQEEQAAPVEAE